MGEPTGLGDLLAAAEQAVERLEPAQALARVEAGATLVDVRSTDSRRRDGGVPGALHIPRTVLEWRLEPGGAWRTPYVPEGTPVVLLCDHGYSSVFAAAALVTIGVDAADVIGGFAAWRDAGLPVAKVDDPPLQPGELIGWRPPDATD
jgi:rhodanese-related sulfurtransferase